MSTPYPIASSISSVSAVVSLRLHNWLRAPALPHAARPGFIRSTAATLLAAVPMLLNAPLARAQSEAMPAPQHLPRITLGLGIRNFQVEVARTAQEQEIGLMSRKTMPDDTGMLFEFEVPAQQCFWMKNTLLPLSVAFIDDQGRIVNIDEMKPLTLDPHCSKRPVRHVLEMNTGWYRRHGLKAGSQFSGAPFGTPR